MRRASRTRSLEVLDVGTGSGAIAISMLVECENLVALATDASLDALAVARENAQLHAVPSRLRLVACDLASAVRKRFRIVVANLPYVPAADIDALEPEVARYEPRGALDGGADGTLVIRRLLADLPRLLEPDGVALFEIGEGQAATLMQAVRERLPGYGVRTERDAAGVERYLIVQAPAT